MAIKALLKHIQTNVIMVIRLPFYTETVDITNAPLVNITGCLCRGTCYSAGQLETQNIIKDFPHASQYFKGQYAQDKERNPYLEQL